MTLETAMAVAKAGGRDANDREALRVLRLEVLRLGLELQIMKEEIRGDKK